MRIYFYDMQAWGRKKINDLNLRFPHLHFQRIVPDFQECEIVLEAEARQIASVTNDPRSFLRQCKFGQSFVTGKIENALHFLLKRNKGSKRDLGFLINA